MDFHLLTWAQSDLFRHFIGNNEEFKRVIEETDQKKSAEAFRIAGERMRRCDRCWKSQVAVHERAVLIAAASITDL